MALTPRGEELGSLVELLETLPETLTVEEMASAIFQRVGWLLSMRDAFGVVVANRLVFGPIHGDAEAVKLAGNLGGVSVKLYSPGEIIAKISPEGTRWVGFCSACGHPENMHMAVGNKPHGGPCGYLKAEECNCESYVKYEARKATTRKKKEAVVTPDDVQDAAA